MKILIAFYSLLCCGIQASVINQKDNLVLRRIGSRDIPRAAQFLAFSMYTGEIPKGQRNELARLEADDLSKRYGDRVGKPKFPSALLVLEEDEEIIGCVGIDPQELVQNRFSRWKPGSDGDVVYVLSNLAIRTDKRKKGYAKDLVNQCETLVKEWNFKEMYLLVDSANQPARKLYKKLGYSDIFEDEDATCVVAGGFSLRTASCVNVCMKKSLVTTRASTSNPPFGDLFGKFFGSFGGGAKKSS